MIYSLKDLLEYIKSTTVCIDGEWVPARPYTGPVIWRLKAAWAVLSGKADAIIWPKGQ